MILPDYPIDEEGADKLRRGPLARKVAELIANFQGKESFVIGIEGVWGSGKTSFINLVLRALKDGDAPVTVVHFNPWNFTGQNELIADFFASLLAALQKENHDEALVKTLGSYASRLQVSFNPSVKFGPLEFSFGDSLRAKGKTLQQERDDIDGKLRELPKKILVVIDDIDRLDGDETRLVMKLVKMTANFPNTVFLLAYDRGRVAKKLDGDAVEGDEYLKKIIQVSFTLPAPDEQELQQILFADLEETINGVYGEVKIEGEDEKRWRDLLHAGFKDLFKTIRDIKRYISSLRLNWSIVGKDDINQIDFLAIEAIRVFAPDFYATILPHQDLFTNGLRNILSRHEKAEQKAARFKELLQGAPVSIRKQIEDMSEVLFPILDFRTNYADSWEQTWRKDRRVCAEERFRFYFQLGIPKGAVSENEVNGLVENLVDKALFSERILELSEEKRLRPMLNKLMDKVDQLDEAKAKTLISALWDLEPKIKDERNAIFDWDDVETQTTRIVFHAAKNAVPEERRLAFFEELIKESPSFYYPTHFVAVLVDQHKKNETNRIEPALIKKEEAEALKAIVLAKIQKMAADKSLQQEEELPFTLYRWQEWAGEEPVKEFIRDMISTREGLLAFLRAFVSRVLSSTGNYNRIDKKGIEPLYPVSKIETLVADITDDELAQMDETSKEAVNLFRKKQEHDW